MPTLVTTRLTLRPFRESDVDRVVELASDRRVAEMTQNIPHPYLHEHAKTWIGSHAERFGQQQELVFAIEEREAGLLIGAIGLVFQSEHQSAELGYWIGVPYWGKGYCTEAARAVVDYGFLELGLHRVQARHFLKNPASGRVMQKIGMSYEGCLRQSVLKWGAYQDVCIYALLGRSRDD